MSKRLFFLLIITPLFMLGFQRGSVTAVYAGPIHRIKQVISRTSALTSLPASGYSLAEKPSTMESYLFPQPSERATAKVKPSVDSSKTGVLNDVNLNLTGPGQVGLTKPIIFSGTLRNFSDGAGISNKTITFTTGGFYLGQTHTDGQGTFFIKINKDLRAGTYQVIASFKGAHLLAPASASIQFEVMPATVQVQTIPATAGITFRMDGRQFISDPDGLATIDIAQAGQYNLEVLLDQFHDPSQQIEFGRWSIESYQPFRDVTVPDENQVQVGLNVFHKVSLKFVDLEGFPVDPTRISAINIRSVQGDVFTLKPGDTTWLPASRTTRRQNGLEETDLLYSVNAVSIDGSNVVNSAQQRFFARNDDTWTITLLLYTMHITVRDGLFASPVGKSVNVVFPNGQIKNYLLDQSGSLQIHALARGIYHISIIGVKGMGTTTPVALSRNQVVKLNIVTRLDIAVIGSIGFGFASGLVLYGRPRLLKSLFHRKQASSTRLGLSQKHENKTQSSI